MIIEIVEQGPFKIKTPIVRDKWIYFQKIADLPKTEKWDVVNNKTEEPLARIEWYPYFRQYAFIPEPNTVYDDGCLTAILNFINKLNDKKKLSPEYKTYSITKEENKT